LPHTSIEGVALSDVLGIPPTGIELYLNNCYVCILSAIIQIDVNSVITVKRPTHTVRTFIRRLLHLPCASSIYIKI